jgi:predicted glycosyltransferase
MRIWFDMTAPAHPLVFRPVIQRLVAAGHEVEVTAREYAQTLPLLERLGVAFTPIGRHGGASVLRKVAALGSRTTRMISWGRRRRFDLGIAHGSNDLALATAALRIPETNMFDYEWATQQHQIGCRLARRVLTPDAIPALRLRRYGVGPEKLRQYAGLKEEYYLADFEPDPGVLDELGVDRARVVVVLRPPPDVSAYHRRSNRLFPKLLDALGRRDDVHTVVVARTEAQRATVRALRFPSLIVPVGAVDAQSLIACADLVVSAGGTMNREAVALGTPVFTTFEGRLGAVDEALIAEGRLRKLTDAADVVVERRTGAAGPRIRRDPGHLTDLLLSAGSVDSP